MLFNSPVFIFLFLPITIAVFYLLNHSGATRSGTVWLIVASLFFYSYWNPIYLPLILASIVFNYFIGTRLSGNKNARVALGLRQRHLLIIGIIANLGLLGYFKYADFFIENINWAFGTGYDMLNVALPLAISFFTFQQIAYLVDSYRNETHEYNFLNYSLFVTFFPQLIAGPIVHHREMMPQFFSNDYKRVNLDNIISGIIIFMIGLFKKAFIADSFAVWARAGFDSGTDLTFFEAWGTSLSYTFQLYYDFSGYTDMAIGAALLLNIRLPINFNSPYKALNIQDFWQRWHITLSRWLRDHVYIPLGGNRKGLPATLVNLLVTFVIGGLWHGAAWTFVIWGAMHGAAMIIHRLWQQSGIRLSALTSWAITFCFVNAAWVVFRATDMESAIRVYKGMLGLNGVAISTRFSDMFNWLVNVPFYAAQGTDHAFIFDIQTAEYILVFGLIAFVLPNSMEISRFRHNDAVAITYHVRNAVAAGALIAVAILSLITTRATEFLYFNF